MRAIDSARLADSHGREMIDKPIVYRVQDNADEHFEVINR